MRTRSNDVLSQLGRKIVNGTIKSGETLPKMEILSEEYDVSRTVIREALQGLAARGFIRSNQRSGTIVLEREDWQLWDLDVMTWISEYQGRDGKFFIDMTNVRLGIEPVAASLAAKNATEKDRQELTALYRDLEATINDKKKWAKADYDFHMKIIEASHNSLMISLLKLLHKGLVISRERSLEALNQNPDLQQNKPTTEILNRHYQLYKAIMDRNEEKAQKVMTDMILRVQVLFERTLQHSN